MYINVMSILLYVASTRCVYVVYICMYTHETTKYVYVYTFYHVRIIGLLVQLYVSEYLHMHSIICPANYASMTNILIPYSMNVWQIYSFQVFGRKKYGK